MIDFNINYADEFVKECEANPNSYPDTVHLMVKRYKRWKKRKDIFWDNDKANYMLYFTETFLKHAKGKWAGEPLILETWQKFFFANIYGWQKYNDDDKAVRVIRTAYLQVPKKNGKTIMGGSPVIYGTYGEGVKGADVYISANTFEQCQNAAIPIGLTIENSPDLRPGTRIYKGKEDTIRSIKYTFVEDGIKYANTVKVLTKDNAGNEGKNPYINYFDEVHAQMDREQYDNLRSAQIAQEEPLNIITSTAGKQSGSLGSQIYAYAKEVLKNDNDDAWFAMIYEPNKKFDWTDREVWKMVNPNMGVSVSMEFLENAFKEAQNNSFNKAEFLSKHLDVFVNYAETYFDKDQLDKMLVEYLKEVEGLTCVIGVDLSRRTDLTCVSINIPTYDDEGNAILIVKQMYFIPEFGIEDKEQQRNVPYRALAEKGFVRICPGKTVDEEMVNEYVEWVFENFDLRQINYDPALAEKLVEKWEMLGIQCVEVPQYPTHMNEPFDDFELLLLQDRIKTDNPLLIFCASNAKIITNINNLKTPSKRKSPEHIDGFVAMLIGHKETLNMMEGAIPDEDYDEYLDDIYR
ncbi:phage terminase large subunit-like protein [Bacillus thuringiensis]|uniref:Phage terminase large subunit-like protein n=1 Tax=Bacillus thuringiensis TaxID=1428 RepID=A0A4R4BMS5_BACTU|nr:terminase TerL endonuclease subunit [Bacillus thuringiensis]TCW58994.1 phage terminase large subunit-like protein [Bacillus thuringiensis]TCW59766.1 phage terminase large subunit-like protein [Bacillus thuringiensis]